MFGEVRERDRQTDRDRQREREREREVRHGSDRSDRGTDRQRGQTQLGSELWTSAPPPRLSLEALQAHYAASYQPRRPRKIS